MTGIHITSDARILSGADFPECSSFFVFHSPSSEIREEITLDIRPSRGSLQRPDENLHIEEIEARFWAATAASEDNESQEAESNPDGSRVPSDMKMEGSIEDVTWAVYPKTMQVRNSKYGSLVSMLRVFVDLICIFFIIIQRLQLIMRTSLAIDVNSRGGGCETKSSRYLPFQPNFLV